MHRLFSLAAVTLVASSAVVAAPSARERSSTAGALRQLPGGKGCWVPKRTQGCREYRVPAKFDPSGNRLRRVSAVIVSRDGRNVYAAANPYSNVIAGFARSKDGSLAKLGGRHGCVAANAPRCERPIASQRRLSALAISPDGRHLYAAADYRHIQGVQAFRRVSRGSLRNALRGISCAGVRRGLHANDRRGRCRRPTDLGEPSDLVIAPRGRELYLVVRSRIVVLRRTRSGGIYAAGCLGSAGERLRKARCAPARGMRRATGVAVTPDGRNVYVASSQGLAAFARRSRDGRLTQLAGGSGCVTDTGADGCAVGRAVARPPDRLRGGGSQVVVSPDGRNVYLAGRDGIAAFSRNRRTGALTQLQGTSGCITQARDPRCAPGRALRGIVGLAVSPDGVSVYAAAQVSRAVAILERSSSGALRQPDGTAACVNGDGTTGCARGRAIGAATAVAVSSDGRNVYVSSDEAGLAVFARR